MHIISAQALEMRYALGRTSNKAKKKKMTAPLFLSRHLFFVPDGGAEGVWRSESRCQGASCLSPRQLICRLSGGNVATLTIRWLNVDYFWLPAVPGPAVIEGLTRDHSDVTG